MNRTPMKRSAWSRRPAPAEKELNREQRLAKRAQSAIKNASPRSTLEKPENSAVVHVNTAQAAINYVVPVPKEQQHRNPRLLALAQGMPCLLRVPGICNRDPATTVAAHSNWACHGKGMARKASDAFSCWACGSCHAWLDQGSAPKAAKQMIFMRAHADQVLLWRHIAADPSRPQADRRAAKWALDLLNATPNLSPAHGLPALTAII